MSGSSTNSRLELKKKICLTALRLFHKRGIRQVKMDDISTTLSISKRTLYELYTNKMELLGEVLEMQYDISHNRLMQEIQKDATTMDILIHVLKISTEELNYVSVDFIEDLHRYPEAQQKLAELEKRRDEETYLFLQKGVQEGFFLPNINFSLMDDIVRVLKSQTDFYQVYGMKTVWTTLVRVFLRSICTQKGIQELDIFLDKIDTEENDNATAPYQHNTGSKQQ